MNDFDDSERDVITFSSFCLLTFHERAIQEEGAQINQQQVDYELSALAAATEFDNFEIFDLRGDTPKWCENSKVAYTSAASNVDSFLCTREREKGRH